MKTKIIHSCIGNCSNYNCKLKHQLQKLGVGFILSLFLLLTSAIQAQNPGNLSVHPNIGIRTNSPVFDGDTLQLMATGGIQYAWAGPNNFVSSNKQINIPLATTLNAGRYFCTVTDDIMDTTIILSIDVRVDIRSVTTIICDPKVCAYSDLPLYTTSGGPGATYQWSDPNGWTSTGQNTVYNSIQNPGFDTIQCIITYNGNTITETTIVEVLDCCTTNPATLLHNINITSAPANLLPTIAILGDLNINVDYTFATNTEIIMLPMAMIEVNQSKKLTLNTSIVRGC